MWDKATFPINKGIFETKDQRLGTEYMLYVSLLLIRDKNDLPTASSARPPTVAAELVESKFWLDPSSSSSLLPPPPHAELRKT